MGVDKNATFIIDLNDVNFADLKADDLGVWKTNGTKTTYFKSLPSGKMIVTKQKTSSHVMTRRYYVHGTYQRFRRVIVEIQGKTKNS